jgi:Protein of unknown function (DUF3108)
MKLAVLSPLFLLACLTRPVGARDAEAVQLSFELYVMGLPVAESHMTFDLAPSTYAMALRYRTTGLARIVSSGTLDQSSSGTFEHDQPVPQEFRSYIRLHDKDRRVTLTYRNGNPIVAAIEPVNETEREIVPPALREHTLDPLSAMVDMLHVAGLTGRCDLSHTTYDGRRLEMFEARTVDEEDIPPSGRSIFSGRALRCEYTSRPMAGLRLGEAHDEDARIRKGTIWLAQAIPGGPRLPVQGLIDIRFLGATTMYLTSVAP